jgi:hypothetical protein
MTCSSRTKVDRRCQNDCLIATAPGPAPRKVHPALCQSAVTTRVLHGAVGIEGALVTCVWFVCGIGLAQHGRDRVRVDRLSLGEQPIGSGAVTGGLRLKCLLGEVAGVCLGGVHGMTSWLDNAPGSRAIRPLRGAGNRRLS